MSNIQFTDTLEVTASHGRLAKAAQIYDDQQKATQAALNQKFLSYTPGTDFSNIIDTDAEDAASAINELADKHVLKGQLIRNADSDWTPGGEGSACVYTQGSIFLVIKDLAKSDSPDFDEYLLPIALEASYVASAINIHTVYMNDAISRLEALEAKLKV